MLLGENSNDTEFVSIDDAVVSTPVDFENIYKLKKKKTCWVEMETVQYSDRNTDFSLSPARLQGT